MQLIREGKIDEAVKMAQDQVHNSPDSAQALRSAATILDMAGRYKDAQSYFEKSVELAPNAQAEAAARRDLANSYGFAGDCKNAWKYLLLVVDYWKTQESAEPHNAFYQEGEMANEAARYCIDSGDLNEAERLYKLGHDLGVKEPDSPARKALWEFRTEHALARLAARHGNKAEAQKHIAAAKTALDQIKAADTGLGQQQDGFWPYLTGYVAFYTGDYKTALDDFQKANQNDAFIQCLIGMTYEKLGQKDKATEYYRKASTAASHNPPGGFARRFTREKLG
jgi:tetratricopeptide (TPR) repeat protein